jgi:hypothetical protein
MNPDFKNFWKWIKKNYPFTMRVSNPGVSHDFNPRDMYNFLVHDMVALLTLLKFGLVGELEKWKSLLLANDGRSYNMPYSTFNTDPEVN